MHVDLPRAVKERSLNSFPGFPAEETLMSASEEVPNRGGETTDIIAAERRWKKSNKKERKKNASLRIRRDCNLSP